MACLMTLLLVLVGVLPEADAFFASAGSFLARATSSSSVDRSPSMRAPFGRYSTRGTYVATAPAPAATSLRGLTGSSSSALFMAGGDMETNAAAATVKAGAPADRKKHVLVPVADGTEEIESVTIIDTLVRAGALVTVASVGDSVEVTCSRGVKITADCKLAECEQQDWDAVVCPGGMPGATHLKESAPLEAILRKQDSDGRIVAAICAAPAVVLAAHGLLEGRKATCYPAGAFTAKIPELVDDKVVVDGNLITSQGPATAMQFALQLVESLFGSSKAEQVGNELLFP